MARLKRVDIAALAQVSRAAVSKAVDRGALEIGADGLIDTDASKNAAWISAKRGAPPPELKIPKPKTARKPRAPKPASRGDTVSPPPPEVEAPGMSDVTRAVAAALEGVAGEKLKGIIARRKKDESETMLKRLRIAQTKGELVPRELVRQRWAGFDAALKSNFRDMPRRVAAQVAALAQAEGARGVEAYLEREIAGALKRTVEAAVKGGVAP